MAFHENLDGTGTSRIVTGGISTLREATAGDFIAMNAPPERNPSDAMPSRVGIVLVDDHPIVREGLARRLTMEPDLDICGQAGDAAEAVEVIRATRPQLVIVDISLPGRDGIDLIKGISAQFPGLLVLVFSMYDELLYAERVLRAGAKGYVMKSESPESLLLAVRRVLSGEMVVGQTLVTRMLHRLSGTKPAGALSVLDILTDRELEIFRRIGEGHQRGRIAADLSLSVKTVEAHRANIRQKLGLENAAELLQHAIHFIQCEAAVHGGEHPPRERMESRPDSDG